MVCMFFFFFNTWHQCFLFKLHRKCANDVWTVQQMFPQFSISIPKYFVNTQTLFISRISYRHINIHLYETMYMGMDLALGGVMGQKFRGSLYLIIYKSMYFSFIKKKNNSHTIEKVSFGNVERRKLVHFLKVPSHWIASGQIKLLTSFSLWCFQLAHRWSWIMSRGGVKGDALAKTQGPNASCLHPPCKLQHCRLDAMFFFFN